MATYTISIVREVGAELKSVQSSPAYLRQERNRFLCLKLLRILRITLFPPHEKHELWDSRLRWDASFRPRPPVAALCTGALAL